MQPRNLGANITSSDPPADPHILTKYDPQRPGSPASILQNSHKDTSFYPLKASWSPGFLHKLALILETLIKALWKDSDMEILGTLFPFSAPLVDMFPA